MIQTGFFIVSIIVSLAAIHINKKEQVLKLKYNRGIVKSDIIFTNQAVAKLIAIGVVGGFLSGALGLGGGTIFNPILLGMGLPPAVASSTSMYMVIYSTASSAFVYFLYDDLNVPYACWIGLWCVCGAIIGLIVLKKLLVKYNRQSPLVMILTFVILLSAVLVPTFGFIQVIDDAQSGANIWELN